MELTLEILRGIPAATHAQLRAKMIESCRLAWKDNIVEQKKIDEFEQTYRSKDVIKWYTKDSFLYRLWNRSFRTNDIDQITNFSPYTIDLNDQ
ncbi:unnamed protein product, partial [Rotaria sp. Silwood2]